MGAIEEEVQQLMDEPLLANPTVQAVMAAPGTVVNEDAMGAIQVMLIPMLQGLKSAVLRLAQHLDELPGREA